MKAFISGATGPGVEFTFLHDITGGLWASRYTVWGNNHTYFLGLLQQTCALPIWKKRQGGAGVQKKNKFKKYSIKEI